jgi:hypothetical protein
MRNFIKTALVAAFFLSTVVGTVASAGPGLMLSDRAAAPKEGILIVGAAAAQADAAAPRDGILIAGRAEAATAAPKEGILIVGASLVRDGLMLSD